MNCFFPTTRVKYGFSAQFLLICTYILDEIRRCESVAIYMYLEKQKIFKIISWHVVMAVVVVGVFFSDIPKAYADTCTWSSGTTASTAVWSNCSGGAPGADDAAIINTGSSSITWDITSVGSITLDTGFSGNVTTSVNITVVTTS